MVSFDPEFYDKIEQWESARLAANEAERRLEMAQKELGRISDELGKYLTPGDAEPGEIFSVMVRKESPKFLVVKIGARRQYYLSWRSEDR